MRVISTHEFLNVPPFGAYSKFDDINLREDANKGTLDYTFEDIRSRKGPGRLEAGIEVNGKKVVPLFIDVKLIKSGS